MNAPIGSIQIDNPSLVGVVDSARARFTDLYVMGNLRVDGTTNIAVALPDTIDGGTF